MGFAIKQIVSLIIAISLISTIGSEALATACTNSTFGSFSCVQVCAAQAFSGTSLNCVFGSNITSGNEIVFLVQTFAAGTLSASGCGITWSSPDTQVGTVAQYFIGSVGSTGACTVTGSTTGASGSIDVLGVEISGTQNSTDGHAMASNGFIAANTSMNSANITTTINGDFVIGNWYDNGAGGGTWTPTNPSSLLYNANDLAVMGYSQGSSGSSTHTTTTHSVSATIIAATVGLKASASAAGAGVDKRWKIERCEE